MQTKFLFTAIAFCAIIVFSTGYKSLPISVEESLPPADSTAKADSILNLKFNPANWKHTINELARWDKCKARQIDSSVQFLLSLETGWLSTTAAIQGMNNLPYKGLYYYAQQVGANYDKYLHPAILYDEPQRPYPIMTEKPVIYLYPTKEMSVTVNLDFSGTDLYTWPKIDGSEWVVTARPDGMLTDSKDDQFPYLFWEGKQRNLNWVDNSSGFVVSSLSVETFLQEKLKVLGLNARERADFITYWGPRMHESSYYFIRFETVNYAKAVPLTITPAPTSMQRIMMVFAPLSSDRKVKEQVLTPFTRKGFTVIEWGGTELPSITLQEF